MKSALVSKFPLSEVVFTACLLFCLVSFPVLAQDVEVVVNGQVVDGQIGGPLEGATLVFDDNTTSGIVTDKDGKFQVSLGPGYHQVKISFIGYRSKYIQEFLVKTGATNYLSVKMEAASVILDDVTVQSGFVPKPVTSREITVEQTLRYAATFYDPVRLSTSLPAINATNDQNNNVSVRGASPTFNQWRLEGVEIANPNHLTNAGTFSDRPTQNGGGVNIFSAQLLDNSRVLFGGFNASYSNALGAVFDNNLRRGDFSKAHHVAQASLLGFDVATEGPFKKGGKSSYLINYRYSFTGLLANLGVDFGGEEIRFQDLSFNLVFPYENGSLKIFGLGGISSNDFTGAEDPLEAEEEKELSDIRFDGDVLAIGLKNENRLGDKISVTNTLVYSMNQSERRELSRNLDLLGNRVLSLEDQSDQLSKLSLRTLWRLRSGNANHLEIGSNAVRNVFEVSDFSSINLQQPVERIFRTDASEWVLSPFATYKGYLGALLFFEVGLTANYYELPNEWIPEPRVYLQYYLGRGGASLYARYGRYSQSQTANTRFFATLSGGSFADNRALPPSTSGNFQIGYLTNFKEHNVNLEFFWNSFDDLPILPNVFGLPETQALFSAFNFDNERVTTGVPSFGQARTLGVEATIEKQLKGDWYYLLGGTYYDSRFEDVFGNFVASRWDGRFAVNSTFGKSLSLKVKGEKLRDLDLNAKISYQGGFRATPLDREFSQMTRTDVLDLRRPLSLISPNYFRLDLRISWRVQKPGYTRTLSIDLQNATNRENFAFEDFDAVTGEVETRTQLGIIPLLTYRVEF